MKFRLNEDSNNLIEQAEQIYDNAIVEMNEVKQGLIKVYSSLNYDNDYNMDELNNNASIYSSVRQLPLELANSYVTMFANGINNMKRIQRDAAQESIFNSLKDLFVAFDKYIKEIHSYLDNYKSVSMDAVEFDDSDWSEFQ